MERPSAFLIASEHRKYAGCCYPQGVVAISVVSRRSIQGRRVNPFRLSRTLASRPESIANCDPCVIKNAIPHHGLALVSNEAWRTSESP